MSDIIISEIEPTYYFIYKTTNLITSAFYVGQHCSNTSGFDGYLGSGIYLKRSIKKYGKENFKREILEFCTSANINDREIFYIAQTSACTQQYPNSKGINITIGGEGFRSGINHPRYGKRHSDNSKKRMSIAKKGKYSGSNNPNYGKKHSDETRRKISDNHANVKGENNPNFGKQMSEESKRKISIAKKGKYCGENNPNFGKQMSEDHKKKLSELHKGMKRSEETKRKISESNKGEKNPMYGKHHSDVSKKKISEAKIDRFKGSKSHCNKYIYALQNGQDYFTFFTDKERHSIIAKFWCKKSDSIIYKGIIINRISKV